MILMTWLQTILIALLTLGILVTIHEFGHFWVARRCGIKVLRFSIGFGTPLWRARDSQGTEYTVAIIPLGGYVQMLDESEGDVPSTEVEYAFNRQSVWVRIAVISAGPAANFLLAILIFWALFLRGETGLVPLIAEIEPETPAYLAGLEVGQEIVSIDGESTPTTSMLGFHLMKRLGDTGTIRIGTHHLNSEVAYEFEAPITRWLSEEERPDPIAGLGITIDTPPIDATYWWFG